MAETDKERLERIAREARPYQDAESAADLEWLITHARHSVAKTRPDAGRIAELEMLLAAREDRLRCATSVWRDAERQVAVERARANQAEALSIELDHRAATGGICFDKVKRERDEARQAISGNAGAARRGALQEAAKVAESLIPLAETGELHFPGTGWRKAIDAARDIADAIRARIVTDRSQPEDRANG